jgi:hypothetical protein
VHVTACQSPRVVAASRKSGKLLAVSVIDQGGGNGNVKSKLSSKMVQKHHATNVQA